MAGARIIPKRERDFVIEFNPNRPKARIRYSIAHEIAHTLFEDCGEQVRNRARRGEMQSDEWQLEMLCNLAAAEILMPFGEFDWKLLRSSAALNGPTDVALTFVDYHTKKNREARRFEQLDRETIRFVAEVEKVTAAPVSLISTRFHSRSIIDRRAW